MPRVPITAVYDNLQLTLAEVKDYLRIPQDVTDQDGVCLTLLQAAKRHADYICQNAFGFTQYGRDGYIPKPFQLLQDYDNLTTGIVADLGFDPLDDTVIYGNCGSGSGDEVYTPTIPEDVKVWVLQKIVYLFERRPLGLKNSQMKGWISEQWGDIEYEDIIGHRLERGL